MSSRIPLETIKDQIIKALEAITEAKEINLEFPENEAFGDYSTNIAMQIAQKIQKGDFLKNIEWFWRNVKKNNYPKFYDHFLPVGKLSGGEIVGLRGSTFAKIRGFREKFEGHPEITRKYFWALPYVLYVPEHFIRVKKYKNRYLLVGHLAKQFAVVIEVNIEKTKNWIVSAFMVKDRYLRSREKDCLKHKKMGRPARTALSPILAPEVHRGGGSRFSTLQDTQMFYTKLTEESQGDFGLEYKLKQNSRELAEEIAEKINKKVGLPVKAEAKGGFINFWLKEDVLVDNLIRIDNEKEKYGSSGLGKDLPAQAGKTVVIDYSSPNIAKPFGIGHLRSTIIGQALYNLYKFLGFEVIGDNHLGDWGTQFGKLLYMLKDLSENEIKVLTISDLEKLYIEFHKQAEKDSKLEEEARIRFRKLEEGDTKAKKLWRYCVDISTTEFERVYQLLEVKIDFAFGESYYEAEMKDLLSNPSIVKHVSEGEDGAKIIDLSKEGINIPLMLLKKDEGTTYATRDLATIAFRVRKWNPDIIIYEVGGEQAFYFKQIFAAARLLGLVSKEVKLVHTAHGLYLAPDGKKFATREGKTIKLEEVLNEAIKRARKLQKEENGPAYAEATARQVGIGAIKYFDLMHAVASNVVFDWEKMMNLEGNSGPYLQYTVARTQSVLQKALGTRKLVTSNYSLMPEEYAVLRFLFRFPEIIGSAAFNYSPNTLCNYLYDLAQKYNTFYNKDRIIGSDNENFRLALTTAVGSVLKTGLKLLGIETPERM